MIFSSSAVK